jgi:hypothetical protein
MKLSKNDRILLLLLFPSTKKHGFRSQPSTTNIGRRHPESALDSPLIGDFLFNARASLDHLIWELVEANAPGQHTTKNMFPICLF